MSQILDLRKHKPIKGEQYFVDTNVWFWTTYVASKQVVLPQQPQSYQLSDYPDFLQKAIGSGARLCHCPLTLAELANVIENTELEIFRHNIKNDRFEKKEFRKIASERKLVLEEIEIAWSTIGTMSKCVDVKMDSNFVVNGSKILKEGSVDPYDAFFIQISRDNKIDYILTDDHDFCSVNKQILITANQKSLKKACF